MFRVFKNKMFWLTLVAVFGVMALFATFQVGVRNNAQIQQIPVALVNEDRGATGKKMVKQLKKKFSADDAAIKWVTVKDAKQVTKGFNNKKYYGALIIDKNFSKRVGSTQTYLKALVMKEKLTTTLKSNAQLKTTLTPKLKAVETQLKQQPQTAQLTVRINQGMNPTVAQTLTTMLPAIGNGLNTRMSQQMQQVLQQQGVRLSASTWQSLASPIKVTTHTSHRIPNKSVSGMAPMLLVVLSWMAALIGSLMLWQIFHKSKPNGRWTLKHLTSQLLAGAVMSVVAAVAIYFFAHTCYGIPVPDSGQLIWLLIDNIFAFFLVQSCVLDWVGMKGWPLIIIVWLGAASVLSYAPEMLPTVARVGIYDWVPMRFSMDAISNALYFQGAAGTMSSSLWAVAWFGIGALVLMMLLPLKKDRQGIFK